MVRLVHTAAGEAAGNRDVCDFIPPLPPNRLLNLLEAWLLMCAPCLLGRRWVEVGEEFPREEGGARSNCWRRWEG